ncbi:hypothetical protein F5Y12DRAFT_711385 [Xylaria sp. FL1777]|nr:hypothetical protein F5Y12DRAFT_711385 [Xylaria sp. FL1777]
MAILFPLHVQIQSKNARDLLRAQKINMIPFLLLAISVDSAKFDAIAFSPNVPTAGKAASNATRPMYSSALTMRDEFSNVLKQLNDIDHALGVLTEMTRQITARPCPHAINLCSPHIKHPSHDVLPLSTSRLLDFIQLPSQDDRRDSQGRHVPLNETIQLGHGCERLYSYPAPLVLVKSLFYLVERLLTHSEQPSEDHEGGSENVARKLQDPVARAIMQQKLEDFPFISPHREFVISSDMSHLTTPPRLMVNLFVNGYLQNINTRTPIFNDIDLHHTIDAHYSDEELRDSGPRALIINNIILLELSLEIKTARASYPTSRVSNKDILPSFLRNCDRAINDLDAFRAPSIINLQALMTLTLVAQEFYSSGKYERVCQAACQVGCIMGIHRSKDHSQGGGADTTDIRGQLFRVLYSMDKTRVFMTGQPCAIHLFDSDQHIGPDRNRQGDDHPVVDAFDHLMIIWEEIYLNLYSSRATRSTMDTRLTQMRFVLSSINRFSQTHAILLSPASPNDIDDTNLLRIELLYGYQVSQILILRCNQDNEQSLNTMRDIARTSLRLILEVSEPPLTTARFALLARMFRTYPMVAFVEIVAFHLTNHSTKSEVDAVALADISLLRGVCNQLQILQYDTLKHIFYARLSEGIVWAIETLEALTEVYIRQLSPNHQGQKDDRLSQKFNNSNRGTAAGSLCNDSPDMFDACGFSSRVNSGFFALGTEQAHLISAHSSPAYQLGTSAFATSPSQLDLASGPSSSDVNWGNFNLDFLQETSAQGNSWN